MALAKKNSTPAGRVAPDRHSSKPQRAADTPFKPDGKLKRKAYEKALCDLHVELVKLQE
jgi:hypothetical protein